MRIRLAALLLASSASLLAQDGSALYKSKCSICHGADGGGRSSMKGSSLLTEESRQRSDEALADAIASGGELRKPSHAFAKRGLKPKQVDLLVSYVRELQKKKP